MLEAKPLTEEHESEDEENESFGDESEDKEPGITDVLSRLSQAVSEKRASKLLHSMTASKDILFWTTRGQLPRKKTYNSCHKHRRAS